MTTPSVHDIALKAVPYFLALGAVVLSLWREVQMGQREAKGKTHPHSGETRGMRRWAGLRAPLGMTGWALVVLALLTCVLGVWSTYDDVAEQAQDRSDLESTKAELGIANKNLAAADQSIADLVGKVMNLSTQLSRANADLTKEALDSRTKIIHDNDVNSAELKGAQDLAFVSLLAFAHEPAEGAIEFGNDTPVRTDLYGTALTYVIGPRFRDWQVIQAFGPFADYIDWSQSLPVEFDVGLGSFRNSKGAEESWKGVAMIFDKRTQDPRDTDEKAGFAILDGYRLIVRPHVLEDPNLADLWNGPRPRNLSARILVRLRGLDKNEVWQRLNPLRDQQVKSATVYYTISTKARLCKKAELEPQLADLHRDHLEIKFANTKKLETVPCPEYLINPSSTVFERLDP